MTALRVTYRTHSEMTCPSCQTTGICDASALYWLTAAEITLSCRTCREAWRTKEDLILDGNDLEGGVEPPRDI